MAKKDNKLPGGSSNPVQDDIMRSLFESGAIPVPTDETEPAADSDGVTSGEDNIGSLNKNDAPQPDTAFKEDHPDKAGSTSVTEEDAESHPISETTASQRVAKRKPAINKNSDVEKKSDKPEKEKDASDSSLQDFVNMFLKHIEELKKAEMSFETSITQKKKVRFEFKYPLFSTPLRIEFHEIIDEIVQRTHIKKYVLLELLLYNGLKATKFE